VRANLRRIGFKKKYDLLLAALTGLPAANIGRAIIYCHAKKARSLKQWKIHISSAWLRFWALITNMDGNWICWQRRRSCAVIIVIFYIPLLLLIADMRS